MQIPDVQCWKGLHANGSMYTCRSLLTNRQDRKDTRVFAHAAAETMGVIFDSYQQTLKSPGTAPMAPTFHSQETGFLEVGMS